MAQVPSTSSSSSAAFASRTFRRLYAAQVVSLAGTGLTTVALGLLAYDLGAAQAGVILGWALALKMVAYVALAPLIGAYAGRVDRRRLLVSLDLIRAALLATLPFVTAPWQVLALVFAVSAGAAGFTPAFQATIPEVLPDKRAYTQALSLSRVAYDLADLLSPVAAAGLLLLMTFQGLFALDAASFLISAALVGSCTLPRSGSASELGERTWRRMTGGMRRFGVAPALRGILALNMVVACAGAMVIVNTVVVVRGSLHLGPSAVALALASAGVGSIVAALAVPRALRHVSDRSLMLCGAGMLVVGLLVAATISSLAALIGVWSVIGVGLGTVQTPIGRVLQGAAPDTERPAVFAAQFALSHAAWLVTYPTAGIVGAAAGFGTAALVLAGIATVSGCAAAVLWRPESSQQAVHNSLT